jgi:uncharacterized membrane protein
VPDARALIRLPKEETMSNVDTTPAPGVMPDFKPITQDDLKAALAAGWADFKRAPQYGIFFAAIYAGAGLAFSWLMAETGQFWWLIPAAFGFPLIAPFVALGLYEVSRRLEVGEPLDWGAVMRAPFRHGNGQIPALAVILLVFFMMWLVVARVIFAVFQGTGSLPNIGHSLTALLTVEGVLLMLVGGIAGLVIALVLFTTQVISLPLLLDRDIDFVSAMIASIEVVKNNTAVMIRWAVTIGVLTVLAMLPAFLGLFVVLPLLGHASWHLYRRAVGDS